MATGKILLSHKTLFISPNLSFIEPRYFFVVTLAAIAIAILASSSWVNAKTLTALPEKNKEVGRTRRGSSARTIIPSLSAPLPENLL